MLSALVTAGIVLKQKVKALRASADFELLTIGDRIIEMLRAFVMAGI